MFETKACHLFRFDQPAYPFPVHFRKSAVFSSRTKPLQVGYVIVRFQRAVDPAVTQRFFHGVIVRNAGFAAVLFIVEEPDLRFRLMVLR